MKKIAMIAALALMVGTSGSVMAASHAGAAPEGGATKADASKAINDAVNTTNAANKVEYEWRDTYKIIGKAKEAFKKGDYAEAIKQAGKAKKQSELALAQQKSEANADIPDYVKAASKGAKK